MLPQILQHKREYGVPVAALTIDGLAICCFNREDRAWEIAFIRGGHDFELRARKVDLRSGEIVAESAFRPIREAKLVDVLVNGGSNAHLQDFERGYFYFKDKRVFNRITEDDSIDYRWVTDAATEIPHGEFVALKTPVEEPLTIFTVPNALFYTKRVTQDSVVFVPEGGDPTTDPKRIVFGRTNELIGAAVYASEPGALEIRYADTGEPVLPDFPMPYSENFFYDISMMNMDLGAEEGGGEHSGAAAYLEGDFNHLYRLFEFDTDEKYQIFAPPATDNRGDEGDCHGNDLGSKGGSAPTSLKPLV